MIKNEENIQKLLKIHYECLQIAEEQKARVGMNPSIHILQEISYREGEISKLEAELGETDKRLISPNETRSETLVKETLEYRLLKLRAFRDTAVQIREFVVKHKDEPELLIPPDLSERFSFLYIEVASLMMEILVDLGRDKTQIFESIMKFINTTPNSPYKFLIETSEGLSFIQMVLRRHEMMDNR